MNQKPIIIYGNGKIANVVSEYVTQIMGAKLIAYTCEAKYLDGDSHRDIPLVPFEEIENKFSSKKFSMHIAIGYHQMNSVRARIFRLAKEKGYSLESILGFNCFTEKKFKCGENCFIADGVSIQPGTSIGHNVSIWSNSVIGHDSIIKDHAWISAGATIGGSTIVGERSFIGLNATIGNGVDVGDSCFIGAKTLVTKTLDQESVVADRDSEILRLKSEQFIKISKLE